MPSHIDSYMNVKVCIINIGNELLLGRTVNTNLSWLGMQLTELGLPVTKSVTIPDDPHDIKSTLTQEWHDNEIVVITGGLGPTNDDLTKKVLADFFGRELEFRDDVWMDVQEIFSRRNLVVPEINKSQAMVPAGFTALRNTVGTAPGLYFNDNGKSVFALPGVPMEMKTLFTDYVISILRRNYICETILIKQLHTWNISESALAEKLKDLSIPEEINLAWLPQTGRVDLRVYGKNLAIIDRLKTEIKDLAAEWVWGEDNDTPQSVIHDLMISKKFTLSVAESCTGGLVQEMLTSLPGASKYFVGGIVAYSNDVKVNQLNVKKETLERCGAVSIETASEMASGIKAVFCSDIGISITGIAGPEGGSTEKPVGTVCFGLSDGSGLTNQKIVFNCNRDSIRFKAAEFIILLLINHVRSRA